MSVAVVTAIGSQLSFMPQVAAAYSGGGAGTGSDPYVIESCSQLLEIVDEPAADYVLGQSIDCDGVTFTPIGDSVTPFSGTFDGNGNTIENVTISEITSDVGIFGNVNEAAITDVRLSNITVAGSGNVGGLVGTATYTAISHIAAYDVTVTAGDPNAGGLVGVLGGATIQSSYIENVSVTSSDDIVGGLVGYAVGPTTVYDSYVTGEITASITVGAVIGQLGIGPAIANNLYADVVFTDGGSQVVGTVAMGGSTNFTFMADNSYLSTDSVAPLDSWDFETIWYVRPGNFPGLRPQTLPMLLCSAPSSTDTTATASCTSLPVLEGGPEWELSYSYADEESWTSLATQSGTVFNVTVTDLLPGTDYDIRFRYLDAVGTSEWGKVNVTTTGSSDVDGDSIDNKSEYTGPNGGDANDDGIMDYTQASVTSLRNPGTSAYMTLETSCVDNFNTMVGLESSEKPDIAFDYPAGLLGFVIRGCTPGATETVTVYYYGTFDPTAYVARKGSSGVYTAIPNAIFSAVSIGGQSALKLSYAVTDGGVLDDDGVADGNIVDPVGIAPKAVITAPNTGLGGSAR